MRRPTEETAAQAATLAQATEKFRQAAEDLSVVAKALARQRAPMEDVVAAFNRLRRAEEGADLAALDLATAGGEDA